MKTKIIYLILIHLLFVTSAWSQQITFPLQHAGIVNYHHHVYCFGLHNGIRSLELKIYRLNSDLKITDSLSFELPKTKSADNYLDLSCDTLHDYLNIYLQQKETKALSIYRFSSAFEHLATINQVDVARLNNSSLFGSEKLYTKNGVYCLKTEKDSTGLQFYVNKYELKSEKENFDYLFKWQFPFERKNVASAHLFFADPQCLMLFVHVNEGVKAGQWVLKLNAQNGQLTKATKLNEKNDKGHYFFGTFLENRAEKSFVLIGQRLGAAQFDASSGQAKLNNAPNLCVYALQIDSLGDIITRKEFKLPISDLPSGSKKTNPSYIVQMQGAQKALDGKLLIETDLYRAPSAGACFFYVNSMMLRFTVSPEDMQLDKTTIQQNKFIEDYYASNDKLDMNGKLCKDSSANFEYLYYKKLPFAVKACYKTGSDGNGVWLLNKLSSAKKTIDLSLLSPQKNVYKLNSLESLPKSANPQSLRASDQYLFIGWQNEQAKYVLKRYNW